MFRGTNSIFQDKEIELLLTKVMSKRNAAVNPNPTVSPVVFSENVADGEGAR